MGKKSAPPPPDYAAIAQQQGQENRDTAQFNAALNRVNQVTPYGNLTWAKIGGGFDQAGYDAAMRNWDLDPNDPNDTRMDGISRLRGVAAPSRSQFTTPETWTQTIALSPTQQKLQEGQDRLSQSYLDTANSAVGRVAAAMATPFDTSKLRDPSYMGAGGTSATVNVPYKDIGTGPALQQIGQGGSMQRVGAGPQFTTQLPEVAQLPRGPQLSAAGGGSIQRTFDTSGVRALPGTIDDASRKRVEEALMSRINPQYQADEQALRTRLLNSGIEVGTDAYNREMANFSQRLNDARMQAVLAGGQEESRQVGLLQALQAQEFDQAYRKGKFGQDADVAMASNALQASQINNNAELARYTAMLAGQNQQFTQGLAAANFGNQWGQQDFQNRLAAAGANNSATQAESQDQLARFGLNGTLAQQAFQNRLTGAQFANNAADQATQRQMQIDQLTNAMALANNQYNNSASQQALQQQAYLRQLPLNEINALRTGAQVQGPQFGSYYTANAGAAPIMDAGIAQGNANAQLAAQQQSGFNSFLGGMAQLGSAWIQSDPRLKTDIRLVGKHPLGIGLYEYTINGQRQRGVMSTEVRAVRPRAVIRWADGYDRVNYADLG